MITDTIKKDYAATLAAYKTAEDVDQADYALEHLLANAHRWLIQLRLDAIAYRRKIERSDRQLATQLHRFEAIQNAAKDSNGGRDRARSEAAGYCEFLLRDD